MGCSLVLLENIPPWKNVDYENLHYFGSKKIKNISKFIYQNKTLNEEIYIKKKGVYDMSQDCSPPFHNCIFFILGLVSSLFKMRIISRY